MALLRVRFCLAVLLVTDFCFLLGVTESPDRSRKHVRRIMRPICLAVFRLMTSSKLGRCSTGRSAGFAPLRILPHKWRRGGTTREC
jgi:hypothetical protein